MTDGAPIRPPGSGNGAAAPPEEGAAPPGSATARRGDAGTRDHRGDGVAPGAAGASADDGAPGAPTRSAEAGRGDAPTLSKERLRTWLKLLKATRGIEAELRERMRAEWGITLPRFDVLAALHRAEAGLTMSELSGVLRVSNGNVTGIVDRLVQDGLVRREAVEGDRRASRVRLTGDGRERFEGMARVHEAWVDELLSPIGAEGLRVIRTRLARITERT